MYLFSLNYIVSHWIFWKGTKKNTWAKFQSIVFLNHGGQDMNSLFSWRAFLCIMSTMYIYS